MKPTLFKGRPVAETYIAGLFAAFTQIKTRGVVSRPVPAEFGVEGCFFRYERHFLCWRRLGNGNTDSVSIMHERMHQITRLNGDFA